MARKYTDQGKIMSKVFALALGCGTQNRDEEWLEVYYPAPVLSPDTALVDAVRDTLDYEGGNVALALSHRQVGQLARAWREAGHEEQASYAVAFQESDQPLVITVLETDAAP